jgi:phosphoribosylaminoimidazolecarboxamide formyltransferase/IMP cyclohydrolase
VTDRAPAAWPRVALLSLHDKRGAAEFARALTARGTRILASGGTASQLSAAGVAATPLEGRTGFGELLGGRVKTLHPDVHAPILARRDAPADLAALAERGLEPIDLVAVSLYPFETRAASLDEAGAIEEIDIGGVALLRAAAKNFRDVIVVHDPSQYEEVLAALAKGVTLEARRGWAMKAFARTARYDAVIASELARRDEARRLAREGEPAGAVAAAPPAVYFLALERARGLRYGENPHQPAALYARAGEAAALEAWREGKELSYNNLLDLEAAVALVSRFARPACVIVKHTQPCGAACAPSLAGAWDAALRSDELSAYGGIVAFNRELDGETAARLARHFVECVAAPGFAEAAETPLKSRKNLRALRLAAEDVRPLDPWSLRLTGMWALLEGEASDPAPEWKTVTARPPTAEEMLAMRFAWEIAASARSNAIAIARGEALIGLGSGQTSRVDAVDVALMKARRSEHDLRGAALASDGFFPFADNIEHAAAAGIAAVVQPGGSMRDAEVIAACDAHRIAMCFTDRRTFRH